MQFRRAVVVVALLLAPVDAFADRHREDMLVAGGPWWGSDLIGAQSILAIPLKKQSHRFEGSILVGTGYYEGTDDGADVVLVPYLLGFRWSWPHTIPKGNTMPVTQLLLARIRREETRDDSKSVDYKWGVLFNPGLEWSLGRGVRARVQADLFVKEKGDSWKFGMGFSVGMSVGLGDLH
jgi:hypothetical protein